MQPENHPVVGSIVFNPAAPPSIAQLEYEIKNLREQLQWANDKIREYEQRCFLVPR